jgi:hypothetical protein
MPADSKKVLAEIESLERDLENWEMIPATRSHLINASEG